MVRNNLISIIKNLQMSILLCLILIIQKKYFYPFIKLHELKISLNYNNIFLNKTK